MRKHIIIMMLALTSVKGLCQSAVAGADTQQINNLRNAWIAALQSKQLAASVNLFTDDAIFFSPDNQNAKGKKELEKLYAGVLKQFDSHIKMLSAGVQVSGSEASDCGSYEETLMDTSTHETLHIKGSYLITFTKQPAKNWKISRMMWTVGK